MKESNARLHSLPSNSADGKSENTSSDYVILGNEQNDQNQVSSVSQLATLENNKNVQNFESIRDPHKSMVRLIDTMFDYLQFYADESNKYNTDPHLNLHWQRPTLEKQKNDKSWLKTAAEAPSFIGKLYTTDWSLIVKGTNELVTSYVIPSDRVISFTSEPEIYSPYLTIIFVKKGANFNWQIDNEIITHEHMDDLAHKLLERLLKSARSQEWSQSVFCLQSIGMGLALQSKGPEISKNLNDEKVDPEQFLIDLMKAAAEQNKVPTDEFSSAPSASLDIAAPAPQLPPALLAEPTTPVMLASVLAQAVVAEPSPPALSAQAPSPPPAPEPSPLFELFSEPMPSPPSPVEETKSFETGEKNKMATFEQNFETALKDLPPLLDQKLKQLTKEGGEAFSKHDLKTAQDMLTLSNELNEFKSKVEEVLTVFKIQH